MRQCEASLVRFFRALYLPASVFVLAAVLLAGCGKNNGSSDGTSVPPVLQTNTPVPPPVMKPGSDAAAPLGDDAIRNKIVGVWKPDPASDYADELDNVTVSSDGTTTIKLKGQGGSPGETSTATWQVTAGVFVVTMTNDDGTLDIESNKVVRVNDHEWVFQEDGETDLTTLHK